MNGYDSIYVLFSVEIEIYFYIIVTQSHTICLLYLLVNIYWLTDVRDGDAPQVAPRRRAKSVEV